MTRFPSRGLSVIAAVLAIAACSPAERAPEAPTPPPTVQGHTTPYPAGTITAATGEVRVEAGPFTDRVQLTDLSLDPAEPPVVHGKIAITSDVSDVIVMEIHAAFYDAAGKLVGTGVYQRKDYPEHTDRAPAFDVTAAVGTKAATAAVLSIPVLVNE